jgi:ferrochelatase
VTTSDPTFAPATAPALARDPPQEKIGVLLVNLGTPDATDYWSMRRYLREFLSDRRVVELPRLLWWPLLNLVILSTRPQRKGKDYQAIWNEAENESPLKTTTRAQAEKLAGRLAAGALGAPGARLVVGWAMRYGNPSIASRIDALTAAGCERLLVVPLYPQYAAATSATVCDKTFEALAKLRRQPTLRVAAPYYAESAYIEGLAASLRHGLAELDFEPEVVLGSFHGIPQSYADKGDPYPVQCRATWDLLRTAMGAEATRFPMSFQSRFGSAAWLQPYTDETVKALARQGVRRLAVITPGFAADCLETIEEIGAENRGYFIEAGGESFALIPCLNDSEPGLDVLCDILQRELAGWI